MVLDNGHPTWLNLSFVEKILQDSEGDTSIQAIDMFLKSATNKGENYNSDLYRITVEFSHGNRAKITKRKTILFKLAPTQEGVRKNIAKKGGFFKREISMMTNTLKKMNDLLGYERLLSPTCIYVQQEFPELLVIEDLVTSNFRLAECRIGLDLDHCLLAIRGLARFHAALVALCEKEPTQKALYDKGGMFSSKSSPELEEILITQAKILADLVVDWVELGKKYSDKIAKLADHIYQKRTKLCEPNDKEFNVINHGDYWVNNMLFKYNDEGKPIDHICVDFQFSVYTSPTMDLYYFFNTSSSLEVVTNNEGTLLKKYHRILSATMKELDCKIQPPTFEELEKMMDRRAAYGMIVSISLLRIALSDKHEAKNLHEMIGKDDNSHKPTYITTFRGIMSKRILMYDEMGLLDL